MDNLKGLRTEKGLTQIDVAVKVGVSLTSYQLWERGASEPSPENLKKLEEVLGKGE
jgi:transcriptional regulator with XRE-family HTH domain